MISVSSTAQRPLLSRQDSDFLRVTASVLVVVVHCVHAWVEQFYATRQILSLGFFSTLVDQCVRFTVPVFFFLSGYGLTCQFLKGMPRLSDYYLNRLPKIVAPFLLWSVLTSLRHIDYFLELPWTTAPGFAIWRFSKFFFFDGFDYQYYFLIILFQFYIVFPFVYKWARKGWVLGISLAIQLIFMTPTDAIIRLSGWELPLVSSSLLILYGFYFCAGIYIAWNPGCLNGILRRLSGKQTLLLWLATWCLLVIEFWVNIRSGKSLPDTDHFNRWTVIAYCFSSFLLFQKNREWILVHIHKNPHWSFLYTSMAPYAFFVYLFHTNVLRVVDFLFWEVGIWNFTTRILWVVIGSYALAWLAQWLLQDYPRLRFALSLPKPVLKAEDLPGYPWFAARFNRRRNS